MWPAAGLLPGPARVAVGSDSTQAFKESGSSPATQGPKSSVHFPLWSGLSEPSQTRKPLRPRTGNHFVRPRSVVLLELLQPWGPGGASWAPRSRSRLLRSACGWFSGEWLKGNRGGVDGGTCQATCPPPWTGTFLGRAGNRLSLPGPARPGHTAGSH